MSPTIAERRSYTRFPVSYPITLVNQAGHAFSTQTLDLSDGGALVAFPFDIAPPVGDVLDLDLWVPSSPSSGNETRRVNCQAKVLRHQDLGQGGKVGIGLQFLEPLKLGLQ